MKYFFIIVILLVSCSKHKLKQPCTLQISTSFKETGGGNGNLDNEGTINLHRITFTGVREEGDDVEIEMEPESKTLFLGEQSASGLNLDIPVGVYKEFQLKIRLNENNSLELTKKSNSPVQDPLIIQLSDDIDLIFAGKSKTSELKKHETYDCKLIWDYNVLFAGINGMSWANAQISNVQGQNVVLINETINTLIFDKIKSNLSHALTVKIE